MNQKTKKPWSGRFKADLDPAVERYTRSLHLDRRLAFYDIQGSRAHVRMLAEQEIISREDEEKILRGLERIEKELQTGEFPYREDLEDIHMNIESRLQEIVGEAGRRIHSGRSRNDQVALDLKLLCLETAEGWRGQILEAHRSLLDRVEELKVDVFPAWTHLQSAQPLSWGHYLLAFCEMLGRDFQRLTFYEKLHSSSPLGAGALSGSTLPLDPEHTAQALGFASSFGNSYDVVGDRDFVLELIQIGVQLMLHLSRLAEDLIYFSSTPVAWVELPDELCTGSSMMPQKKNPDVLELIRGKTASVLGHGSAMAALLKGLPTSYHRDLQQDKEHLFGTIDTVTETLEVIPLVISGFQLNEESIERALKGGFLMATDLAEYLVRHGVPFRKAHEVVGKVVGYCVEREEALNEIPVEKLQELLPEYDSEIHELFEPKSVLKHRSHKGSTGENSIDRQLAHWRQWIRKIK